MIARTLIRPGRRQKQTNVHRRNITLNGPFAQAISKPQSELGKVGRASRVVRIKNSPFSKAPTPETPKEPVLIDKKKPIAGFGDDS